MELKKSKFGSNVPSATALMGKCFRGWNHRQFHRSRGRNRNLTSGVPMFHSNSATMKLGNTLLLLSRTSTVVRALSTFRPILISIEGKIGAGKSTLIEALKVQNPSWNYVEEPVGMWSSLKNEKGTFSTFHISMSNTDDKHLCLQ